MMISSAKLLTLALIGYAAASPVELHKRAENIIIGYRTVSPEQARIYNEAGTVVYSENRIGTQTGSGVYTTAKRGAWAGSAKDWTCVILADKDAVNRVSKAWVPKVHDGKELWFKEDKVIDEYIKGLEDSWDPAKTLRMSIMDGREDVLQMSIPFALLNEKGGGMGLVAICKENANDIPDSTVNYDDWHENIKGNRQ